MGRRSPEVLHDALSHLRTAQAHAQRDLNDQVVIDAVCMRLSAGIEALANLDPDLREQLFAADWPLMWGMRNRIAHGYVLVDAVIVRRTLIRDVPTIVHRIEAHLEAVAEAGVLASDFLDGYVVGGCGEGA
ncbi:MAG: DUF86 domain-containing protein [Micrococcales bacterium]|nr:DUF86 domain-containing protein [Micrococcales bacterium]